jgi:hypothetical protein
MEVLYLLSYGSKYHKASDRLDHFPCLKHKTYCKVVAQKSKGVRAKFLKKIYEADFSQSGAVK